MFHVVIVLIRLRQRWPKLNKNIFCISSERELRLFPAPSEISFLGSTSSLAASGGRYCSFQGHKSFDSLKGFVYWFVHRFLHCSRSDSRKREWESFCDWFRLSFSLPFTGSHSSRPSDWKLCGWRKNPNSVVQAHSRTVSARNCSEISYLLSFVGEFLQEHRPAQFLCSLDVFVTFNLFLQNQYIWVYFWLSCRQIGFDFTLARVCHCITKGEKNKLGGGRNVANHYTEGESHPFIHRKDSFKKNKPFANDTPATRCLSSGLILFLLSCFLSIIAIITYCIPQNENVLANTDGDHWKFTACMKLWKRLC